MRTALSILTLAAAATCAGRAETPCQLSSQALLYADLLRKASQPLPALIAIHRDLETEHRAVSEKTEGEARELFQMQMKIFAQTADIFESLAHLYRQMPGFLERSAYELQRSCTAEPSDER